LADTHAIIWYLENSPRLSATADAAMSAVEAAGGTIYISAITPVEIIYLVEKGKVPASTYTAVRDAIADPNSPLRVLPVTEHLADVLPQAPRAVVPDMPDRIIASTAIQHRLQLVTADARIRQLPIPILW
jgi:PIN domain nuclease of toxin-antitoxin system